MLDLRPPRPRPGSAFAARRRWLVAVAAWSAIGAGCAEELGPIPKPTARVTGRVRVGALPVGGGWVEFLPVDGTVGDLRSAPIRPDGTFEGDRVAVGLNAIRLVNPPRTLPGGRLFLDFNGPLRRTIPDGSSALEIDLRAKLFRYSERAGRAQSHDPAARDRPRE